jgi:hypothetical protein
MKRILVLAPMVMLMAAMMVIAGPASAEAGCQEFGVEFTAFEAQLETGVGEEVSAVPPGSTDDTLNLFKADFCSAE